MNLRLVPDLSTPAPTTAGEDPGVVVCQVCRVDFDRFTRPGEAGRVAAEHNRQHHGGRPVAFMTESVPPTPAGPGWHVQPCTEPGCGCRQWVGDEEGSWTMDDFGYAEPDFCLCGHGWFEHLSVPEQSTPGGEAA